MTHERKSIRNQTSTLMAANESSVLNTATLNLKIIFKTEWGR